MRTRHVDLVLAHAGHVRLDEELLVVLGLNGSGSGSGSGGDSFLVVAFGLKQGRQTGRLAEHKMRAPPPLTTSMGIPRVARPPRSVPPRSGWKPRVSSRVMSGKPVKKGDMKSSVIRGMRLILLLGRGRGGRRRVGTAQQAPVRARRARAGGGGGSGPAAPRRWLHNPVGGDPKLPRQSWLGFMGAPGCLMRWALEPKVFG